MDMRKYARRSAYVKVDDVRNGPIDGTIAHIKQGRFEKPDLTLESGKVISLNGGNTEILINAFGAESDRWIGKKIRLSLGTIHYQGEPNETVIVEPISPPIKQGSKRAVNEDDDAPFNDEIPY